MTFDALKSIKTLITLKALIALMDIAARQATQPAKRKRFASAMARRSAKKERVTVRFNLEGDLKDRFTKYRHANEFESNKDAALNLVEEGLETWHSEQAASNGSTDDKLHSETEQPRGGSDEVR